MALLIRLFLALVFALCAAQSVPVLPKSTQTHKLDQSEAWHRLDKVPIGGSGSGQFSEDGVPEREEVQLPASRFAQPECSYQVRRHSPEGPPVDSKVMIGETLFHRWECAYDGRLRNPDSKDLVYCMMVHSCTISSSHQDAKRRRRRAPSGGEEVVEIVDEFGCSAWPNVLPNVRYSGDLRAVLEAQTFALDYDKPAVFFKCAVRLLLKVNGRCRRPQCAQSESGEFRPANSPLNFP